LRSKSFSRSRNLVMFAEEYHYGRLFSCNHCENGGFLFRANEYTHQQNSSTCQPDGSFPVSDFQQIEGKAITTKTIIDPLICFEYILTPDGNISKSCQTEIFWLMRNLMSAEEYHYGRLFSCNHCENGGFLFRATERCPDSKFLQISDASCKYQPFKSPPKNMCGLKICQFHFWVTRIVSEFTNFFALPKK
jgi:hypothetical protein